jgi:hypothetical protein
VLRPVDPRALVLLRGREADARLQALVRERARVRPRLGRLAEAFVRRRHHERLGFRCLGDWSRERLGVGAHSVRAWARVWKALVDLPALRAAVASGEVGWTVAERIAPLATPENERLCLETVQGRTVRAVEAIVEAVVQADGSAMAGGEWGEERVRVRIRCGGRVAVKWSAALELARRMAGEEMATWEAAEAIAAEAASAFGAPDLEAGCAGPGGGGRPEPPGASEVGLRDLRWPHLHWHTAEDGAAPRFEDSTSLDEVPPRDVDRAFRREMRFLQRVDFTIGRILGRILQRHLHRELGFGRFDDYVRERLDLSPRTGRRLVRIARAERTAPEVAIAFRAGRITLLQAEALLAGAGQVADAERVTLRKLREALPPPRSFWAPPDAARFFLGMVARWGLETVVDHAIATWLRVGRRFGDYADFERDGWRCTVPACTARRNLQSHHIVFLSAGGPDASWNRTTLCAWHHQRGVHGGLVGIRGRAPDRLEFVLGVGRFGSGDVRLGRARQRAQRGVRGPRP